MPVEVELTVDRIDRHHDPGNTEVVLQHRISFHGKEHGCRVCQAGGLDEHAGKRDNGPTLVPI